MTASLLHHRFLTAAHRFPERLAATEAGTLPIRYRELEALSARVRDWLVAAGVRPGDRVGIYLPKTIDAVATLLGVLRAGAAYVPVDPGSPPWRAAYILNDCAVRALVVERALLASLAPDLAALGADPVCLAIDAPGGGAGLRTALDLAGPVPVADEPERPADGLAYVLYTSGSTGKPKGVTISHQAALAFVEWCARRFRPLPEDRFSSHAPFHFDLSVLDLYLPLHHGASVALIGEELGKDPQKLAQLVAAERLTVWYSTPSILNMLVQYGHLDRYDLEALRLVLFAGEVFPLPQFRALRALLPHPAYHNLYGPTETNVCTAYEVPAVVPADRVEPFPIGWPCEHYRSRVVDPEGNDVARGTEGELLVSGVGVMSGYWNLPERNAAAFLVDRDGVRWYRTGDLVVEEPDGCLLFHGRADRMVKRRGYRIELGEIEAGLARHPAVREVAVVATSDMASGVRITAFLSPRETETPSLIALKQFAVEVIPRYMAPDAYRWLDAIPRTSTDKTDYQRLKQLADPPKGGVAAGR
jgi:amino acid adenylation domain-containing protein